MIQLKQELVEKVVAALPDPVKRMLRMSRLWLAGGFIRSVVAGETPQDIDIFGSSKEELKRYARILANSKGMRETRNAITVQLPATPQVQFILRWVFDEPEKVIESFDFTIAQAIIWFDFQSEEWKGLASIMFEHDVTSKFLVYTSPVREEDAAGSLLRVRKFLERGYTISDEDLAKVTSRVVNAVHQEIQDNSSFSEVPLDFESVTKRVFQKARRVGGDSV